MLQSISSIMLDLENKHLINRLEFKTYSVRYNSPNHIHKEIRLPSDSQGSLLRAIVEKEFHMDID